MQIYCDFSAYSDIAIGIAALLGYRFQRNFNQPYRAESLQDFWRRWHMSLSSWLRDYLYIPLGGNRYGELKTYRNLLLTMVLGGIWHGAAWKFVIWGALHGGFLAVERATGFARDAEGRPPWRRVLGVLLIFHFVCFCWIFFRAPTTSHASARCWPASATGRGPGTADAVPAGADRLRSGDPVHPPWTPCSAPTASTTGCRAGRSAF